MSPASCSMSGGNMARSFCGLPLSRTRRISASRKLASLRAPALVSSTPSAVAQLDVVTVDVGPVGVVLAVRVGEGVPDVDVFRASLLRPLAVDLIELDHFAR